MRAIAVRIYSLAGFAAAFSVALGNLISRYTTGPLSFVHWCGVPAGISTRSPGFTSHALPLSIDTLAMIYNKDLFNTAGIATVPATWEGLQADLKIAFRKPKIIIGRAPHTRGIIIETEDRFF